MIRASKKEERIGKGDAKQGKKAVLQSFLCNIQSRALRFLQIDKIPKVREVVQQKKRSS